MIDCQSSQHPRLSVLSNKATTTTPSQPHMPATSTPFHSPFLHTHTHIYILPVTPTPTHTQPHPHTHTHNHTHTHKHTCVQQGASRQPCSPPGHPRRQVVRPRCRADVRRVNIRQRPCCCQRCCRRCCSVGRRCTRAAAGPCRCCCLVVFVLLFKPHFIGNLAGLSWQSHYRTLYVGTWAYACGNCLNRVWCKGHGEGGESGGCGWGRELVESHMHGEQ